MNIEGVITKQASVVASWDFSKLMNIEGTVTMQVSVAASSNSEVDRNSKNDYKASLSCNFLKLSI
jgi:hypothetical protein